MLANNIDNQIMASLEWSLNGSPWKLCCFGLSVVISINFPVLRGMVPLLVSWGEETLLSGEALSTL